LKYCLVFSKSAHNNTEQLPALYLTLLLTGLGGTTKLGYISLKIDMTRSFKKKLSIVAIKKSTIGYSAINNGFSHVIQGKT